MINYLINHKGKLTKGKGLDYEKPADDDFIWIFLADPSEKELEKVTNDFSLNPRVFKSYPTATHSKRYSTKPYQFVFVDYFLEKNKISHTSILFTLDKNFMIITIPQQYKYYFDLFERINGELSKIPNQKRTLAYLLYLWLMEDTEENYDVLTKSEEIVSMLEHQILKGEKDAKINIDELIHTKRLLFKMTRRFWASAKIIYAIKKGLTPITPDLNSMMLLDDVYDTFHHQLDIAAAQRDMLTDSLEIYATMVSNELAKINNNMSVVMKNLTALTVIIMAPSLVAGIYGMNFTHIPFAQETYGFIVIISGMTLLALAIFIIFYKKEWI